MKLTTGILTVAMVVGGPAALVAVGQNPDAIDNARSVAKSLQQKQANDTDAALNAAGAPAAKPVPGAPAPSVKPAVIPGSTAAATASAPAKPASKPAAPATKSQSSSAENNQLQKVNVVPGGNDIQIELTSSSAVAPRVSRLSSPARVLVELPETVVATSQSKIPVGSGGVKGVRIGMDGKNPPTTSVVVDLEKALSYDVSSGPTGTFALILHTQGGAPAAQAAGKTTPAAAPATAKSSPAPAPAKAASVTTAKAAPVPATKVADAKATPKTPAAKVADAKAAPAKNSAPAKQGAKAAAPKTAAPAVAAAPALEKPAEPAKPKAEEKKWAMSGKRDPFFSPVIQQQGSGCSTGKKCLEINGINLRGVVKSDNGFIAVVTNNIGKAYFLHENDPVFNGYVVKITGDSIVFEETVQDKLGKTSTHEVVKRIFTPAV
jgi:Tfp pilus assembly protein PilP